METRHWIIPKDARSGGALELIRYTVNRDHMWDGDPRNVTSPLYSSGDIAYFMTSEKEVSGWGIVVESHCDPGRIVADDDEEGQTPPWWVESSEYVSIQPRVIFSEVLTLPGTVGGSTLEIDQARAISSMIRRHSEPRVITLEHLHPQLIKRLTSDPEEMRNMDWRDFEYLLAKLLDEFGYIVDLRRGTKDGGVDLFALSATDHPLGPHKYLLQAKRWKNAVGVQPVRELKFLHDHHGVTKSCLATTSVFTKGAWQLARNYPHQLELRDFDGLRDWIRQAWSVEP